MNVEEKLTAIFDAYNMPTSNPFYHAVRDLFLDVTDTSPCKACSMNEASCCGCPTYYAWKGRKERRNNYGRG